MNKYKILFVDDEINILHSLKRGLRVHCPDWHVEFCSSAADALLLLEEFEPLVVVSDKRMPNMDGIAFLRLLSQQSPEIIRVLLTGDCATKVVIEAADVAHILIYKPFKIEMLVQQLQRAFSLQKLPISLALRKQLGSIEHIPVLPKAYQQLVDSLNNDDADFKEIARLISLNPLLLGKLIQLANSVFFSFSSPVSNVYDTVVRLGIDFIKRIVLCFGLFDQFDSVDKRECDQLFTDAMNIALLSQQFSSACGLSRKEIDDSFVLGLFHNMGMVMSNMSVIQIESNDSDTTSQEENAIGAYLLALWGFDSDFINAILFQHIPEAPGYVTPLSCRLHVAKVVYNAEKRGFSALDKSSGLNRALLKSQGLLDNATKWINNTSHKFSSQH
jgi:HD-like signal output (HDOD) protein/CheY-like chemotaxis protein